MKCEDIEILLSSYIAGEINIEEKKQLEKHLEKCIHCQKILKQTQSIFRFLKEDSISLPPNWEKFPERLAYKLLKEKIKPRWAFKPFIWGLGLAMLIMVFFLKPFKLPETKTTYQISSSEKAYTDIQTQNLEATLTQGLKEYFEFYEGGWENEEICHL